MTIFCKDCLHLRQTKRPWFDYWNEIILAEDCASMEVRKPGTIDYVTGDVRRGRMPAARHINTDGKCRYFEEKEK